MVKLSPCKTPWCVSQKVHTTTFHKSKKVEGGPDVKWIEVEHSCPVCHVRTPQSEPHVAERMWNMPTTQKEPK